MLRISGIFFHGGGGGGWGVGGGGGEINLFSWCTKPDRLPTYPTFN